MTLTNKNDLGFTNEYIGNIDNTIIVKIEQYKSDNEFELIAIIENNSSFTFDEIETFVENYKN